MRLAVFLAVVISLLSGCSPGGEAPEGEVRSVFVSVAPLRFFAERIGGDRVRVTTLVAPGQSPATYEPTPKQMTELASSDLFFVVGVPMENRLVPRIRAQFPGVAVHDVRDGLHLGEADAGEAHAHGGSHDGPDPHVWLSPPLAVGIAGNVCDALVRDDPAHARAYRAELEILTRDLMTLDAEISKKLAPYAGRDMVVFHPAFGYFAGRYGLNQVAIERGGVAPGTKMLSALIERSRNRGVRAVFVQPQFSPAMAQNFAAEIGADVVELDPLAPEYITNMQKITDTLISVYRRGDHGG